MAYEGSIKIQIISILFEFSKDMEKYYYQQS